MARKYKNKNIHFYAVASNAANVSYLPPGRNTQLKTEVATLSLPGPLEKDETPPYPILPDYHHEIADSLHATHTPETFLIDPKGCVVFHGDPDDSAEQLVKTGRERVTRHYLASALERALAGKKVIVPVSGTFGCEIDRSDVPDDADRSQKKGDKSSGKSQ